MGTTQLRVKIFMFQSSHFLAVSQVQPISEQLPSKAAKQKTPCTAKKN